MHLLKVFYQHGDQIQLLDDKQRRFSRIWMEFYVPYKTEMIFTESISLFDVIIEGKLLNAYPHPLSIPKVTFNLLSPWCKGSVI